MQCAKSLSKSCCVILSWWVWPPTVKIMCWILINHILPMPDAIGTFYHPRIVTNKSHKNQWLWQCQERKLSSLPKVKTRRRCNDIEIEHIGRPRLTVSQQPEQVMTRHSRSNDVEFECIGMPHTILNQQAQWIRVVTGQRVMKKDNWSQTKMVYKELFVQPERLQLISRITNESQYQFWDLSYTATKPRWQWKIVMMISSTEPWIFKRGR